MKRTTREGEREREGGREREREGGREGGMERERERDAHFACALPNTQGGGALDDLTLDAIEQAQPTALTIHPC